MKKHGGIPVGGGKEVANPWFAGQVRKRRKANKQAKASRKKNR